MGEKHVNKLYMPVFGGDVLEDYVLENPQIYRNKPCYEESL